MRTGALSSAEPDVMGDQTVLETVLPTRHQRPVVAAPARVPPLYRDDPFDIDDGVLSVMSVDMPTREAAATAVMNELEEFITGCVSAGVPSWVDSPSVVRSALAGHADVTLKTYWDTTHHHFVGYPLSDPPSSTDLYFEAHLESAVTCFRVANMDNRLALMPIKAALRVRLTQLFEAWSMDLLAKIQGGADPLTNMDSAGMMDGMSWPASPPSSQRRVYDLQDVINGSPQSVARSMDARAEHERDGGAPTFGAPFSDVRIDDDGNGV